MKNGQLGAQEMKSGCREVKIEKDSETDVFWSSEKHPKNSPSWGSENEQKNAVFVLILDPLDVLISAPPKEGKKCRILGTFWTAVLEHFLRSKNRVDF